MLELSEPTAQALRVAIDSALAEGADAAAVEQVIHSMVAERIPYHHTVQSPDDIAELLAADAQPEDDCGADAEVIYLPHEVPDGLIDLPSAAKKYGIPVRTLQTWVRLERLPRKGRVRAPAAGGGYILTVEELIPWVKGHPRKPWHKKSSGLS